MDFTLWDTFLNVDKRLQERQKEMKARHRKLYEK